MPNQTNEQALEATIQKQLTGSNLEELLINGVAEPAGKYASEKDYMIGWPENFNAKYALDEKHFWSFLENTQQEDLEKLQRHSDWKLKILERYDRMVKKYGILHLLKKGLAVEDAHFTLFYQLPLASSSPRVHDNFKSNQFSKTGSK